LATLPIPDDLKIGVMIDAKTVLATPDDPASAVDKLFSPRGESRVSLVRIAAHCDEVANCRPIVERLKSLGYLVGLNIMQELELSGRRVSLYSPVYNETFIDGLRDRMERHCEEVRYFMIPDGAALLRHLPRKKESPLGLIKLIEMHYQIETADCHHTAGSYSNFIEKIYHYPAKHFFADPEKIEIVPVPTSDKHHSNEMLVIGGLQGISKELVEAALRISEGSLEEHLLERPYRTVLGPYSTALMFNHLFVSDSESRFLIDGDSEDADWQETAEACGIPVIRIAQPT
jgi:hypothetical protein